MFASSSKHAIVRSTKRLSTLKCSYAKLTKSDALYVQRNRYENSPRAAPVTKYNVRMLRCDGAVEAFKICTEMKEAGIRPDMNTYHNLMHQASRDALVDECWAVYQDMLSCGFVPTANIINSLLNACRYSKVVKLHDVLREMRKHGVKPSAGTYTIIIQHYTDGHNLEAAVRWLNEMSEEGLEPSPSVLENLIMALAERGHARLALDLADAFEHTSASKLNGRAWAAVLIACSEMLYADGVSLAWPKVAKELKITPDEGLCLQVLHTAARHGLAPIAVDVLRVLKTLGIRIQEQHLTPVLEAFVSAGQLREAFQSLELFRSNGVIPTRDTLRTLVSSIEQDSEAVDSAYLGLEDMHREGKNVDVVAVNAIIEACAFKNDLPRAVGTYKSMSSLGVTPDIDTYNLLITACAQARHHELGQRTLQDMKESGIKPVAETYKALISLALTQADYEDAFFYLEEMKGRRFKPPLSVYEEIVRRCVYVGDSRYTLAVEELLQKGYELSDKLKADIDSGGARRNVADSR